MPNSDTIQLELLLVSIILVCIKVLFSIYLIAMSLTKKKYICANEAPFMSKELHKAIMKRSKLKNIFLKHQTDTNKKATAPKKILETLEKH